MDWMYKDPKSADPEEFLLGRAIDKSHFKDTSPVNYMRSIKNEPESSRSQVDMPRKMLEDPLTTIRQKEIEHRKFLYQKSQIKHGEKLIPVHSTLIEPEEKQSKSLEQLIIENLKQLPFNIDVEKLYNNLKEKKKLKKQQKNEKVLKKSKKSRNVKDDSSDDDFSSSYDDVRLNKCSESKSKRDEKLDPRRVRVKHESSVKEWRSEHDRSKYIKHDEFSKSKMLRHKCNEKYDAKRKTNKSESSDEESGSEYENSNNKKCAGHSTENYSRSNKKHVSRIAEKSEAAHEKNKNKLVGEESDTEHEKFMRKRRPKYSSGDDFKSDKRSKSKNCDKSESKRKRKKSKSADESSSDYENSRFRKYVERSNGKKSKKSEIDDKDNLRCTRNDTSCDLDLRHTNKHNVRCSSDRDFRKDKHKKERFSNEKTGHKKKQRLQENYHEKKGNDETSRREYTKRYSTERRKSDEISLKRNNYQIKYPERSKEKFNQHKKQGLTEEEKEAKRKEMMENAIQRDTERKRNIKKYEVEDKIENEKSGKCSEDFTRNQLSALMSSENSVEKRIKSNVNNIQRNKRDMDRNFARRY